MEIRTAYTAYTTIDERGSEGELIGIFIRERDANAAAQDKGWYGGPGHVKKEHIVDMGDGKCLLLQTNVRFDLGVDLIKLQKDVKTRALAKLTDHEKEVLGLK